MLTGRRAFDGEDMTDTLAAVLRLEPDWAALPLDVPPPVTHAAAALSVRRIAGIACARHLRRALFVWRRREPRTAAAAGTVSAAPLPRRRAVAAHRRARAPLRRAAPPSRARAVWFATRPADPVPPRVSRLSLASSGTAALTISGIDRDLAITPDGSRVVYVGNHGTQLFVRALDALEPVAVFTGAPRGPFVSPDGQWIGFVDGDASLKKVAVTGGPAVTLATLDERSPRRDLGTG